MYDESLKTHSMQSLYLVLKRNMQVSILLCLSPWYIYHIECLRPVGHVIIGAMLRDTIKGTL